MPIVSQKYTGGQIYGLVMITLLADLIDPLKLYTFSFLTL